MSCCKSADVLDQSFDQSQVHALQSECSVAIETIEMFPSFYIQMIHGSGSVPATCIRFFLRWLQAKKLHIMLVFRYQKKADPCHFFWISFLLFAPLFSSKQKKPSDRMIYSGVKMSLWGFHINKRHLQRFLFYINSRASRHCDYWMFNVTLFPA